MSKFISPIFTILLAGFIVGLHAPAADANEVSYHKDGSIKMMPDASEDHIYRHGRAIFEGRHETVPQYDYCLNLEGKRVEIKNKTMRPFKKSSYPELGAALFDCNDPDASLANEIPDLEFQFVLYYLNMRYKLDLSDVPSG